MIDDTAKPVLETELAYFEQHREEWLKVHPGKFALIRGEQLESTYDSDGNAYKAGVALWGNVPFLIKEILPVDRVHFLNSPEVDARMDAELEEMTRDEGRLRELAEAEEKLMDDGWNGCVSVGGLYFEMEALSHHRRRMDECGIPEKDQASLAMFVEGVMGEGHTFGQVIDGNPEYRRFAEEAFEQMTRKAALLKEALQRLGKPD